MVYPFGPHEKSGQVAFPPKLVNVPRRFAMRAVVTDEVLQGSADGSAHGACGAVGEGETEYGYGKTAAFRIGGDERIKHLETRLHRNVAVRDEHLPERVGGLE